MNTSMCKVLNGQTVSISLDRASAMLGDNNGFSALSGL